MPVSLLKLFERYECDELLAADTFSADSFLGSVARMKSSAAATRGLEGASLRVDSRSITRTAGHKMVVMFAALEHA